MTSQPPPYVQILTAGRAGSTFLANFLQNNFPESLVIQEREPARLLRIVNNIAATAPDGLAPGIRRLADTLYTRSRRRWIDGAADAAVVIEVNPFICEFGSRLAEVETSAVVHVIRHPVQWVISSIGFGSYSWRRPIVPYLPFVRERPARNHSHWPAWSEAQRFAWRWVQRNRAIREYLSEADTPSIVVRYEDLFAHGQVSKAVVERLASHVGLPAARLDTPIINDRRINPTPDRHQTTTAEIDVDSVMALCETEARHYGYTNELPE